jgi:hypothetical protein
MSGKISPTLAQQAAPPLEQILHRSDKRCRTHTLASCPNLTSPNRQSVNERIPERNIRIAFWCAAVLLGATQAWNNRHVMNSDGICYLDLSDAYLQGGWKAVVNGHWSPFYPWLLALARLVLRPSGYWEFATVHLVNFLVFLCAAAAFEILLREFLEGHTPGGGTGDEIRLPGWAFRAIAYLTFLWLSLTLITLERKSPDMLMSIFVYLAIALVLGIRRHPGGRVSYTLLGIVLGTGYLAKAPMFPLAFMFLVVALFATSNFRNNAPRVLLAFVLFTLVSAPLVVGLSQLKGRFTFGDSGRWNYLTEVNGAGPVWYMQDVGSARGKFIHPPEKIFDSPSAYAFVGPIGGTLPAWYDPSYWIEGAMPRLDRHRQLVKLLKNAGVYLDLIFTHQVALLVVFTTLVWMGAPGATTRIFRQWPAWLPALAALAMYAVVLVEERYVAVFLIVLWVALFSTVRWSVDAANSQVVAGVTVALAFALGTPLLVSAAQDFNTGVLHRQRHTQWEMAEQLRHMGIQPGDRVGRIGGLHRVEWARLLHVQVIAEIPRDQAEYFWSSGWEMQAQVIESFRKVGVKAIVAEQIPPAEVFAPPKNWHRIGDGHFFVYMIGEAG